MSRLFAVLLMSVAAATAAFAGPYTDATRADQLCTDYGRNLGSYAFLGQGLYRADRDLLAALEAKKAAADASSDEGERLAARETVRTAKEIRASSMKHLAEVKAIYMKSAVDTLGARWKPIAEQTWRLVLKVDSEERARDLGYAACMDAALKL